MIIQKRTQNGEINLKISDNPTFTENYVESMENHSSSSGICSQGLTTLEILQKVQEYLNIRQVNPEQFEGRTNFMSMFDDILWTKKGNSSECFRIPRR